MIKLQIKKLGLNQSFESHRNELQTWQLLMQNNYWSSSVLFEFDGLIFCMKIVNVRGVDNFRVNIYSTRVTVLKYFIATLSMKWLQPSIRYPD